MVPGLWGSVVGRMAVVSAVGESMVSPVVMTGDSLCVCYRRGYWSLVDLVVRAVGSVLGPCSHRSVVSCGSCGEVCGF